MRTRDLFRDHWGSMGGGPWGPRGSRGAFRGSPGLMSLQMIHEAYKPVNM